jgi:hypothetical protein
MATAGAWLSTRGRHASKETQSTLFLPNADSRISPVCVLDVGWTNLGAGQTLAGSTEQAGAMCCVCNAVLMRSSGVAIAAAAKPPTELAAKAVNALACVPSSVQACLHASFVMTMIMPCGTLVANVKGKLRQRAREVGEMEKIAHFSHLNLVRTSFGFFIYPK